MVDTFLPWNWFIKLSGFGMAINSLYDRLGSDSAFEALARFFSQASSTNEVLKST